LAQFKLRRLFPQNREMAKHRQVSAVNTGTYLLHPFLKQPATVSNRDPIRPTRIEYATCLLPAARSPAIARGTAGGQLAGPVRPQTAQVGVVSTEIVHSRVRSQRSAPTMLCCATQCHEGPFHRLSRVRLSRSCWIVMGRVGPLGRKLGRNSPKTIWVPELDRLTRDTSHRHGLAWTVRVVRGDLAIFFRWPAASSCASSATSVAVHPHAQYDCRRGIMPPRISRYPQARYRLTSPPCQSRFGFVAAPSWRPSAAEPAGLPSTSAVRRVEAVRKLDLSTNLSAFCCPRDHSPQNSGCIGTAQTFSHSDRPLEAARFARAKHIGQRHNHPRLRRGPLYGVASQLDCYKLAQPAVRVVVAA
jgi:hypothetical protein